MGFQSLTLSCQEKEMPLFFLTEDDVHKLDHWSLGCLQVTFCRKAWPLHISCLHIEKYITSPISWQDNAEKNQTNWWNLRLRVRLCFCTTFAATYLLHRELSGESSMHASWLNVSYSNCPVTPNIWFSTSVKGVLVQPRQQYETGSPQGEQGGKCALWMWARVWTRSFNWTYHTYENCFCPKHSFIRRVSKWQTSYELRVFGWISKKNMHLVQVSDHTDTVCTQSGTCLKMTLVTFSFFGWMAIHFLAHINIIFVSR